jgi:hypothetical protein
MMWRAEEKPITMGRVDRLTVQGKNLRSRAVNFDFAGDSRIISTPRVETIGHVFRENIPCKRRH